MAFHADTTGDSIHVLNANTYTDIAARDADTAFQVTTNVNKLVRVDTPLSFFILASVSPTVWVTADSEGADEFTELTDTPSTYVGQALKLPFVNAGETALEFTDTPTLTSLTIENVGIGTNPIIFSNNDNQTLEISSLLEVTGELLVGNSSSGLILIGGSVVTRGTDQNLLLAPNGNGNTIAVGELVVGTQVNPDGTLHVHTASAGTVQSSSQFNELVLENSGDSGMTILSPDANFSGINLGSPDQQTAAAFRWKNSNNLLSLGTFNVGAEVSFVAGNGSAMMRLKDTGLVIGATSKDASAILQLDSTTQGFLTPRMTETQKNAIASPATGLTVYDTDLSDYQIFDGVSWNSVSGGDVTGAASSTDNAIVRFNGTTGKSIQNSSVIIDDNGNMTLPGIITGGSDANRNTLLGDLALDSISTAADNVGIGYNALSALLSGNNHVAIGSQALAAATSASGNTAVGQQAMAATSTGGANVAVGIRTLLANGGGKDNVAVGFEALMSSTSDQNTAVGFEAGRGHTSTTGIAAFGYQAARISTAMNITAIGRKALANNTTGTNNTALGHQALLTNSVGNSNIAIGTNALFTNTIGLENVGIGVFCLDANLAGTRNVAVGFNALSSNINVSSNTAIGWSALEDATASNNTAVGASAGIVISTGSDNTILGFQAGDSISTGDNNIVIGKDAATSSPTADNEIVLGNASNTSTLLRGVVTGEQFNETDLKNVVKVYVAADLPDTLVANTNYVLQAPITVSTTKTFPSTGTTLISTTNLTQNTLTYSGTGTLFAGTSVVRVFLDVQIDSSSTGTLYGVTGDGTESSLFFHASGGMSGWDDLGTLTSFANVIQNFLVIQDFDAGLKLVSCNAYLSQESTWFNFSDSSTDFITVDASITQMNSLNVGYFPFPNERIFNINSSATINAFITLVQGPTTATTYFNSAGKDQTDPGVIATNCANLPDSTTSSELFLTGNTATTDIPLAGAMVEINVDVNWTDDTERMTISTDGTSTYNGLRSRRMAYSGNINLEPTNASKSISLRTVLLQATANTVTFTNATNLINETSTPRANGDVISFRDTAGTLPTGIRSDVVYFVISKLTNSFQISYTSGGSAITFSDDGTPTNSYKVASLEGATPTNTITASNPRDLIPQATIPMDTNDKAFLVVINNDDAVDINVNTGYQRYSS